MRYDRLGAMEQFIREQGTATLEELAQRFRVSLNTIRRDVAELVRRGSVVKVYGGVSVAEGQLLPISVRSEKMNEAKQRIGKLSADFVKDNSTIFLDAGSTPLCILPHLSTKKNITIVTYSLAALIEASKYPDLQVIALGGLFSPATFSYVGSTPLEALRRMRIDTVFIAASAVSAERGLMNNTYLEAEIKRYVVRDNDNIILMTDHTKFGQSAVYSFADLSDITMLVTDCEPEKKFQEELIRRKIKIVFPQ